jgi:hypothetical protein
MMNSINVQDAKIIKNRLVPEKVGQFFGQFIVVSTGLTENYPSCSHPLL